MRELKDTNESAVREATGSRTEDVSPPRRLSEFTGKPQYADYVCTDSEGSHHYYSELTSGIEVLEDGEIV